MYFFFTTLNQLAGHERISPQRCEKFFAEFPLHIPAWYGLTPYLIKSATPNNFLRIVWEVMPHTSLSLKASSRYPPNSQISADFCNLAKNSRIDWPSTSLHLWNLYLSAMSNGFGVKFRPITSTISVNDNSVGLVGVAVRLFNKAYQSFRANWLPFSRWEHCSLRKTGFQTL